MSGITRGLDLFKSLVYDQLVTAAIGEMIVAVPFLGCPVIRQLFTAAVDWIADRLYDVTEKFIDTQTIILINDEQKAAYQAASINLALIAHDKGQDSQEFKDAHAKELITLKSLIQYNSAK